MVLRLDLAPTRRFRVAVLGTLGVCVLFVSPACSKKKQDPGPVASASASAGKKKLTPELAKKTLAKVGDRVITLGEYEATLERMDPFERMRYQSQDRRKRLLDEMIEVELLSQEARRRGLDKTPETQERLQILREQMLEEVRKGAPAPNDVPDAELKAYYDQHKDEFAEPERRRVAGIVLDSASTAKTVLAQALKATPAAWGELVEQRSTQRGARPMPMAPSELAGDLGIVGPPGHARGANPRVPEAVREAVFKIAKVGDTHSEVVPADGKYYVVRLMSSTPARERKYEDSERAIRTAVVQAKIREKEQALESDLKKKFPVTVDDAALAKMPMPPPASAAPPTMKPDMRMIPTLGAPPRLAVPPPAPPPPAPPKAPQ